MNIKQRVNSFSKRFVIIVNDSVEFKGKGDISFFLSIFEKFFGWSTRIFGRGWLVFYFSSISEGGPSWLC